MLFNQPCGLGRWFIWTPLCYRKTSCADNVANTWHLIHKVTRQQNGLKWLVLTSLEIVSPDELPEPELRHCRSWERWKPQLKAPTSNLSGGCPKCPISSYFCANLWCKGGFLSSRSMFWPRNESLKFVRLRRHILLLCCGTCPAAQQGSWRITGINIKVGLLNSKACSLSFMISEKKRKSVCRHREYLPKFYPPLA